MTNGILRGKLRECMVNPDEGIELTSGRVSRIYFDLKRAMFSPGTLNLMAIEFLQKLKEEHLHLVGGLELGAVPLVAAIVAESWGKVPMYGFVVRKHSKVHGTRRAIEGHMIHAGKSAIVDDVATTGGSILRAIEAVRASGGDVQTAMVVIDREEGAREVLAAKGVGLYSLFTMSELLWVGEGKG